MSTKFVKLKNIGYSIVISMKLISANDPDSLVAQNKKRADDLISQFKNKKIRR